MRGSSAAGLGDRKSVPLGTSRRSSRPSALGLGRPVGSRAATDSTARPSRGPFCIHEEALTVYKGHRIEVYAERVDGAWDAIVRIRRVLTDDKPYVERVACRKLSAEL